MYCLNHLIATRLEVPSCGTISDFHICKSLIRGRGKQRAICVRMANIDCRVAHLTISFANGGRREVIRSLMRHLPDYGVSSSLCCLTELGCPREEAPGAVLVNKRSLFDFPAIRRLAEFCDTNRVSVIHAHDASSQFAGALLRLIRPRTRLLMTFHRSLNFESASRSSRIRNALAGLLSQAVVTVSRERTEHYLQQTAIPARKVILSRTGRYGALQARARRSRAHPSTFLNRARLRLVWGGRALRTREGTGYRSARLATWSGILRGGRNSRLPWSFSGQAMRHARTCCARPRFVARRILFGFSDSGRT